MGNSIVANEEVVEVTRTRIITCEKLPVRVDEDSALELLEEGPLVGGAGYNDRDHLTLRKGTFSQSEVEKLMRIAGGWKV